MPATIKLNSTGPDVSRWQALLGTFGFPVSISGHFDTQTDTMTREFQRAKGLVADGIVGPNTWRAAGVEAPPKQFAKPETHRFGREAIAAAWVQVTGREANLAELQYAGATAQLESNYGRSNYLNELTGEKRVLNNWGAVTCGHRPPCGPGCFETTDTDMNGKKQQACYKIYEDPVAGAAHMIEHLTKRRPTMWEHIRVGDIDAAAQAGNSQDPITKIGVYHTQSGPSRAAAIADRVLDIANALGEPVAARRGGPVEPGSSTPAAQSSFEPGAVSVAAGTGAVGIVGAVAGFVWWLVKSGKLPWPPW